MTSAFTVKRVDAGPRFILWDVRKDYAETLRVETRRMGPSLVQVGVSALPLNGEPALYDAREDATAAFHAATARYDASSEHLPKIFPAITRAEWRAIEDALDVERALDVA